jgi:hypothetical protein
MVISPEMNENEMGNRGSKSALMIKMSVKEQRVDGSYLSIIDKLRCTLMDCESNYQISIPSKQNIIQKFGPFWQTMNLMLLLQRNSSSLNRRVLNRNFYTHSNQKNNFWITSKFETLISSPFPPKGALMDP